MRVTGILLCLASAAAFGAMGMFGKLAYEQGSKVATLLSTRFVVAALVLWLLLAATGGARRLRTLGRRDVLLALGLGAVGYGAQAGCYFAALERMDASLLALVLYTFPAMVAVAAIALGRDRASARTAIALVLAGSGLALVLAGAAAGSLEPAATALGLGAAVVYTVYILTSEGIASRVDSLALATLVCTGAAVTLTAGGLITGGLDPAAVTAPGLAVAGGAGRGVHGGRHRAVLRRPAPRRPDRRGHPVHAGAGGHRGAGLGRVRRVARPGAAGRRRAGPVGRRGRAGTGPDDGADPEAGGGA